MKNFIFALLLSIPVYATDSVSPLQESARLEQDILNGRLAENVEKSLDALIHVAATEIRKKGHSFEADSLESEWFSTYKYSFRSFTNGMRDIGDHAPLSVWLAQKYDQIEFILGVQVCKNTHLSDLKTFNFTIPIVFKPCVFPMDNVSGDRMSEYRKHFSEGNTYYGLVPVTSYWITYAAITGATFGTGYVYIASLGATVAEKLIAMVAPKISDKVYERACN